MARSFHQMLSLLAEAGPPPVAPPAGGAGGMPPPPTGGPPAGAMGGGLPPPPPGGGLGGMPPGGMPPAPGADDGQSAEPVEVEAGDVWDALEAALDKLEGKGGNADKESGESDDTGAAPQGPPPAEQPDPSAPPVANPPA